VLRFPFFRNGYAREDESSHAAQCGKNRTGGRQIRVFTCPSCYHTWKNLYQVPGVELKHSTQMLYSLIKDKRIKLKEMNVTVTYHDPCDLGRNSGSSKSPGRS